MPERFRKTRGLQWLHKNSLGYVSHSLRKIQSITCSRIRKNLSAMLMVTLEIFLWFLSLQLVLLVRPKSRVLEKVLSQKAKAIYQHKVLSTPLLMKTPQQ